MIALDVPGWGVFRRQLELLNENIFVSVLNDALFINCPTADLYYEVFVLADKLKIPCTVSYAGDCVTTSMSNQLV